jgi:uroporphyrinogen decarboxylase
LITQNKLISTLLGNNTDVIPPIWFMRQAGRYLPEYREIRSSVHSFMELCSNVDLATKITLQPIQRFDLDAAIIFSDILVIPNAMGMELKFVESQGPVFNNPITSLTDINKLLGNDQALEKLEFVSNIVRNVRKELHTSKSVIGFSGSPFTVACYMLEGKSNKNSQHNFHNMFSWIAQKPNDLLILLQKLAELTYLYLISQIEAGADTVMIFDTWGGILSEDDYKIFSFQFIEYITNKIKLRYPQYPVIAFTKTVTNASTSQIENMHKLFNYSNCDAVGVDYNIDLKIAIKNLSNKTLQGNLNPEILAMGDLKAIKSSAKQILDNIMNSSHANRFVFNLGHGILPNTNLDHVKYLVDFIRNYHNVA